MSHSYTAKAFAAAAIVGLIAAAAPARADDVQTRTQVVRVGTLDLRTAGGQTMLRHRVTLAARKVCGPVETFGTPGYGPYESCLERAQQQATIRVNDLIAGKTVVAPASA